MFELGKRIRHQGWSPWVMTLAVLACAGLFSIRPAVSQTSTSSVPWPQTPLGLSNSAAPLVMLVASRDHKLFYEAYSDTSDLDGDGILDTRFNPRIRYLGLFNSNYCYDYTGSGGSGLFVPSSATSDGRCPGRWSGNWLNYITTSRIDALRVVLYGGHREVDTPSDTILRRAYIPQDAHSWAKEYTSPAVDGYNISDYTPLTPPSSGRRHFFGNLTANANTDCATPSNCSNLPPLLRVVTNSSKRVWEWASKERPVLDGSHGGTAADYTVRVRVCTDAFVDGCKRYPAGNYKPVGILHEYGEDQMIRFGLITGSYDKNMSGGVLRKNMSNFGDEVNSTYGTFTASATIVQTFNALRIRDFNNGRTDTAYRSGWNAAARMMNEGEMVDWGNPIGEMMYEAVRYFAGKNAPTAQFDTTGGHDGALGLPRASVWQDPYTSAGAARCSRAFNLVLSDINPSFDSDQVPGSFFASFSGDLAGFSASTELNTITGYESAIVGSRFIGQSGSVADGAPTPKTVSSLATIRGLAPEEPNKQGSYNAVAVSYFAKRSDLRPDLPGVQSVDSLFVTLSSPLPTIQIPITSSGGAPRYIIIIPFAKTIGGGGVSNAKGSFQPTNQIVDFYIDRVVNVAGFPADSSINSGRPYYKFRINFEDVEWGGDHDMDAVAEYEVLANADGSVTVRVTPVYQAGSMIQNMGYVISGSNRDGVYLVVSDEDSGGRPYYLNVPPGQSAGYCDPPPASSSDSRWGPCSNLPRLGGSATFSEQTFWPGSSGSSFLRDPLWYAAKWGGFTDSNGNLRPDLTSEWDADGDGVPDTYLFVHNPTRLRNALRSALDRIVASSRPAVGGMASSGFVDAGALFFQTVTDPSVWSGDLLAYNLRGVLAGSSSTPLWKASENVPSPSGRNIWTYYNGTRSAFSWPAMPVSMQSLVVSADTVNYLRGDRTKEIKNGGVFRNRPDANILGTFLNSEAEYVPDNNLVCAGSNDGMLHCFDAATGVERFAYIPGSALPKVKDLASPTYNHQYLMDGPVVVTSRAATRTTAWPTGKNILIATPGRGGRGLFALDVTNPAGFNGASILWDATDASDNDLGYIFGEPVVTRTRSGELVVLFGNGYASVSGRSVLYVMRLSDGALLKKIDLGGTNTGLGAPTLVDVDGDGYHDFAYAAGLWGGIWKIDIRDPNPASWGSAFVSGGAPAPLFVARDSSGNQQFVTSRLTVATIRDPASPFNGQNLILFGTGAYFRSSDVSNTQVQTLYGLYDNGSIIGGRTDLYGMAMTTGTLYGRVARSLPTPPANALTSPPRRGWLVDLPIAGERVIWPVRLGFSGSGDLAMVTSMVPNSDPCTLGYRSFVHVFNPFHGGSAGQSYVDVDGDGDFADEVVGGAPLTSIEQSGVAGAPVLTSNSVFTGVGAGTAGGGASSYLRVKPTRPVLRWRELLQ
ncbi:MAG: PilC/PilY family type IV pilus protein [Tepidimonas sp.]|uniref:pilus assembly protein n=1 Tax=Tepidimonas sp. TaxID=2002775 RepID=UPI00298F3770|nr:PilC/PilY family type IV pilus protein [Tepidimonas sp.]MDW8336145.1 PilC/PilY family type IV pilus protein [Tepidimonas sp.]